jgi:hypothetical protein
MTPEFETKLLSFVEGCKAICAKHGLNKDTIGFEVLLKRVRVYRCYSGQDDQRSVHCFIDLATGDVLKSASWTTPAKHARGNIFDEHNGLRGMGPYGTSYLR